MYTRVHLPVNVEDGTLLNSTKTCTYQNNIQKEVITKAKSR